MDPTQTADTLRASSQSQLVELLDLFTDQVVRGEAPDVDRFLAAYPELADQVRPLLQTMLAVREAGTAVAPNASSLGEDQRTLGDFQIVQEIGRGGMGVVYEAQQLSLQRRVALKILPFAAVLDDKRLRRFKNEAHAAAQLHHEHIVPVYAIGCERGLHYYAMQFIEGSTLATLIQELRGGRKTSRDAIPPGAADEETEASPRTSTAEESRSGQSDIKLHSRDFYRLAARLGRQVALALDHAHQCGVIHRDIKPSNLLLDKDGKIWVTDFGLAQIQAAPDITLTGDVVGTFRYMSPEQALGARASIDHHTDIYSLGATLYELIALRPVVSGADRAHLLRRVIEQEPTSLRQIDRRVPRDLETIVMKCVAKTASERYATASVLADDLQRFLNDEPIEARRPSRSQRAAKWVQRHRVLAGWAAASLVLALIGLTTSSLLIWNAKRRTDVALQLADDRFWKAHQLVDDYFTTISEEWLIDEPGMQPLRRQLLEKAQAYLREFTQLRRGDPRFRRELALAHYRLGLIIGEIGSDQESLEQFSAAQQIWQPFVNLPDAPRADRMELANTYLQMGRAQRKLAQGQAAVASFEEVRALLQPILAQHPDDPAALYILAASHRSQGMVHELLGQPDLAIESHRRAVDGLEQLLERFPDHLSYQQDLAKAHEETAHTWEDLDNYSEARQSYLACVAVGGEIVSKHPNQLSARILIAGAQSAAAMSLAKVGQASQALQEFDRVIAELDRLSRENPAVIDIQLVYGATLVNAGELLFGMRDIQNAEQRFDQAAEILERVPADGQHSADYVWLAGALEHGRGLVKQSRSDYQGAAEALLAEMRWREKLLDIRQRDGDRQSLAECCSVLGIVYRQDKQLEEALRWGNRACQLARELVRDNPDSAHSRSLAGGYLNNLGITYERDDQPDRAMQCYDEAIQHQSQAMEMLPEIVRHGDMLANHYCNKATLYSDRGALDESADAFRVAADLRAELVNDHPQDPRLQMQLARNLSELGKVDLKRGQTQAARQAFEKAEAVYASMPEQIRAIPMIASFRAQGLQGLAELLNELGDPNAAQDALARAIALQRQALKAIPTNKDFLGRLAEHLFYNARWKLHANQPHDARVVLDEALAIWNEHFVTDESATSEALESMAMFLDLKADLELADDRAEESLAAAERACELRSQLLESYGMPAREAAEKLADSLDRKSVALKRVGRDSEANQLVEQAERLRIGQD